MLTSVSLPATCDDSTSASAVRQGVIDCFAGIGGFAHAILDPRFGARLDLSVELDEKARSVYAASFPGHDPDRIIANIRQLTHVTADGAPATPEALAVWEAAGMPADGSMVEASAEQTRAALRALGVDPGDIGWLLAGAPCTTFSKSGAQAGVRDRVRGTLFGDVALLVDAVRPDFVVLENVPNMASARHRDWMLTVIERLRSSGYAVGDEPLLLSPDRLAPEFGGTPQSRRRLFIAARRVDAHLVEQDPSVLHASVDVGHLADAFAWDPARWDPTEICDPDESFDTAPFLLAPRERVWIDAWNALVQALPCDDLPMELYVDAMSAAFTPEAGTHPAAAARMRRFHAHYLEHAEVYDAWLARTWDLEGSLVSPADFPKTRRILEWQARSAQPTRAERDLWQCTFSFRSSGIRVKPLTTLPALVALNTTSVIGPRARYITPREAARLQGFPTGIFEPPVAVASARRLPVPDVASCPPATHVPAVPVTDEEALGAAAAQVCDLWWARGGYCDSAVRVAVAASGAAGVSPGEVLIAAAAMAASQPRWRGSGLRWADLSWDAYRTLSPGSPIAFDPVFAAVDWRVRRRMNVAMARAAGCPPEVDESGVDEWIAERVSVALPGAGSSWRERAQDIALAVRVHGLDVLWLRALHRLALLGRSDRDLYPLSGLADLDEHLASFGVLTVEPVPSEQCLAPVRALELYMSAQVPSAREAGLADPVLVSKNTGAGLPLTQLPLSKETLEQGRARLAQLEQVLDTARARTSRLRSLGEEDPRAQAAVVDAMRQYILAAFDVRRHSSMHAELLRAGEMASMLHHYSDALGLDADALQDAAYACVDAWALHLIAPPFGPMPSLVLPLPAADGSPPAWLPPDSSEDAVLSLPDALARADALMAVFAPDCDVAGAVVAAHYERERSRLAHVLALVDSGALAVDLADELVFALTRRPSMSALWADACLAVDWVLHHAPLGGLSWTRVVEEFSAPSLESGLDALPSDCAVPALDGPVPAGSMS